MASTITLSNVVKRFGRADAVRDVSFVLSEGETIALVGHNGAGKTTLMKLMLGLLHPTSGRIDMLGDNPAEGAFEGRSRVGYLPENIAFNAALTGRETLTFYARLKRQPINTVEELLSQVGLDGAADKRVGAYSKGMRQRLGLAQALLGEPRVLLLDEPTTGLDPALRQTFYAIVQTLRDRGATVLLSSHALTELEEQADRVIIMNRGIKVADGSIDELRKIASLPIRIRTRGKAGISLAPPAWLPAGIGWRWSGDDAIEIDAMPENKLAIVRSALSDESHISDIDITPPTLDELYAHFLHQQENGQ